MDTRKRVDESIKNGTTVEWAAGFAVKHTVELIISTVTAALLAVPAAFVIPFLPVPGIDVAVIGITASLEDLTWLGSFVLVWVALSGIFFVGTRCNYP